jgi:hypothetical protein
LHRLRWRDRPLRSNRWLWLWLWRVGRRLKSTSDEITLYAVRGLVAFAAAEAAFALIAAVAMRPTIVTIPVFAARRIVPIETVTAVTPKILPVAPVKALVIGAIVTIAVVSLITALLMPRLAIIVAILMLEVALLRMRLLHRFTRDETLATRLLRLTEFIGLIVAKLVAVAAFWPRQRMRPGSAVAERIHPALSQLLVVAQDDSIIVFGMLQIVFSKNWVTGRKRVAR